MPSSINTTSLNWFLWISIRLTNYWNVCLKSYEILKDVLLPQRKILWSRWSVQQRSVGGAHNHCPPSTGLKRYFSWLLWTFGGSFLAVLTPPIARVGGFFSIFRDLHNSLNDSVEFCKPLHHFSKFRWIFAKLCKCSINSAIFQCKFHRILSEFHRMLGNCWKSMNLSDFLKFVWKFEILRESFGWKIRNSCKFWREKKKKNIFEPLER